MAGTERGVDTLDDHEEAARSQAAIRQLDELLEQLKSLEEGLQVLAPVAERPFSYRQWPSENARFKPLEVGFEDLAMAKRRIATIHGVLERIAGTLSESWTPTSVFEDTNENRKSRTPLCLGRVVLRYNKRRFLRGFVERREIVVIATALPERLFYYLLTVPGIRDQLQRDIHGHWGYHYHYIDERNRRSDTLLTFDQQSQSQENPTLCWEHHSDGRFKARAQKWGREKRESVYAVCHPDSQRWPLSVFKRPGSGASVLWP